MAISVAALRLWQLTGQDGQALPSPKPLDPAAGTVPFGVELRVEVDLNAPAKVHPLEARVSWEEYGARVRLFPTAPDGVTYSGAFRFPLDLPSGTLEELTEPPRFPLSEWGGNLPLGGGKYEVSVTPVPLGTIPDWPYGARPAPPGVPTYETTFTLAAPASPGGAPPTLVSLSSPPPAGLRLGEPWLLEARVEKTEAEVLGVFFCSLRPAMGVWYSLRDDGTKGDRVAGDGVHSLLRVGGDYYDVPENWPGGPVPITLSAQAVDVRGNWSEPLVVTYQLRYDLPPVWYEAPSPGAPHILEASADRALGPIDIPLVQVRCDRPEAWVCAHLLTPGKEAAALYPDAPGSQSYSLLQPSDRRELGRQLVVYAVAPAEPTVPGERVAVGLPALVPPE